MHAPGLAQLACELLGFRPDSKQYKQQGCLGDRNSQQLDQGLLGQVQGLNHQHSVHTVRPVPDLHASLDGLRFG